MWMEGLTLSFISVTFLLLAPTSPGTWGVAFGGGGVHRMSLSQPCLPHSQAASDILLAQQVSSVVVWNPAQQKWSNSNLLMLPPPPPQAPQPWLTEVIKCWLNSPWQNIWTLVQVMMEESKTAKWAAPAANHVQQPWNVYSQAYMKAARNSIVTQIGAEKAFGAFASLMRWTNPHHSAGYYSVRVVTTSRLLQNDKTNNT